MFEAVKVLFDWADSAAGERLFPLSVASCYLIVKIGLRFVAARLFPPAPRILEAIGWLGVDLIVLTASVSVIAQISGGLRFGPRSIVVWYTVLVVDLLIAYVLYLAFRKISVAGQYRFCEIVLAWTSLSFGLIPYLSIFEFFLLAQL